MFRASPRYHQKLDFIVQNLLGNIANAFPSLLRSLWWPRSRLPSRNRYSVYNVLYWFWFRTCPKVVRMASPLRDSFRPSKRFLYKKWHVCVIFLCKKYLLFWILVKNILQMIVSFMFLNTLQAAIPLQKFYCMWPTSDVTNFQAEFRPGLGTSEVGHIQ